MSSVKPPVLFIHGAGGGGWQWRDWRHVFWAVGYVHTLAPDLRPSPRGLEATTLDDYIAQMSQVVQDLGSPPVIVGASMGGLIGLKLAEHHHLAALVLVNSAPPAGTPGWPPSHRDFPPRVPWGSTLSREDTYESMPEADTATVTWAHARWRDESGKVMQALYDGVPAEQPDCPVLVICSGRDASVPPTVCEAAAQLLAAERKTLAGASHVGALLGERSSQVAQGAIHWLQRLERERRGSPTS